MFLVVDGLWNSNGPNELYSFEPNCVQIDPNFQRRERDLYRLRNIFRINILSNSAKRTLEMHGCKESMLIMKNNLRRILKER